MTETPAIRKDLNKLFRSTEELKEPEESRIEGKIPFNIHGTILRVGPGRWDFDNFTMNHYLDGYAVLSKFEISNSSVKFYKRMLQSESYKMALRAQRPVVTEFGTRAYPEKGKGLLARFISAIMPEMSDNNISNIFQFGADFYVSNDACYFRKINQKSLESAEQRCDTNKLFSLNGWTAHPLQDAHGDTYNVGFSILAGLKFYVLKIPPKSVCQSAKETFKKANILCTIPSSYRNGISYAHSFGMTERYLIFIEQPYFASVSAIAIALMKQYSAKDWMEWKPHLKNRFHIIDKATGLVKTEYLADKPFFFLHFVNCYQPDEHQLVVDIIAMDDPGILEGMFLCKLRNNIVEKVSQPTCRRFVIPISNPKDFPEGVNCIDKRMFGAKAICHEENRFTLSPEILTEPGCEMPAINQKYFGRNYSYFYVSGTIAKNSFSHSICKIDIQRRKITAWRGNEYLYPGEPIFVPNPNDENGEEDNGVLISTISDVQPNHNDFIIFIDARSMKEVARTYFKSHIPGALHGIFINSNQNAER